MSDPITYSQDENLTDKSIIFDKIKAALKSVKDPEIPVDIYELGLIYDIGLNKGHLDVSMTLTAPACPVAETLPKMVEMALLTVDGIDSVKVEVVWDPPWNSSMMSEEARLELGME